MMAFPALVPRIISTEKDPSGLARWISFLVEGKGTHKARIVTGYFPCKPSGSDQGLHTVYNQHKAHWQRLNHPHTGATHKPDREPHRAWLEDFKQELSSWVRAGEHIIIQLDANSDVRSGIVAKALQSMGFKEQITHRHGINSPPPSTYWRNHRGIPIDGIWTNFGHGIMRCGYLAHDEGLPGDHRTAWIDIPLIALL